MKLINNIYNYCFGDFWDNQYNATLVEYYLYLGYWINIAFN